MLIIISYQLSTTPNNSSSLFGGNQNLFHSSEDPLALPSDNIKPPDLSKLTINSPSYCYEPPLPAYQPAQYLSTIEEYMTPTQDVDMDDDEIDETPELKAEWRDARWEQLLPKHVDVIFERFIRRLENAEDGSQQLLRYVDCIPDGILGG